MFLHPPIGACAFKTNTVSLLSGRVSCQWDWFPRKEVSVSWLLFNKCTVSIIQAFEQIPFAYRKNPELFSLLSKINQVLEFITDSQTVVQSNPKVGCFDCLVWSFFFFSPQVKLRCQVLLNLFGCFVNSGGAQTATWSCYPGQPLLHLTSSQRHIYSGWY